MVGFELLLSKTPCCLGGGRKRKRKEKKVQYTACVFEEHRAAGARLAPLPKHVRVTGVTCEAGQCPACIFPPPPPQAVDCMHKCSACG